VCRGKLVQDENTETFSPYLPQAAYYRVDQVLAEIQYVDRGLSGHCLYACITSFSWKPNEKQIAVPEKDRTFQE
jgi:hypothetical protein